MNTEKAAPAPTVSTPKPEMRVGGAIQAFVPQNFEEAWRIATTVVEAKMAPAGLDSAAKVMVAIMHGQEVGFTPMAALQSIAVINGRPTIWGDGALGLVQGSGKLEWIKETVTGDGDARVAICQAKRFNDKEIKEGRFSVADAKAAGLWGKAGPWKQYSDRMLKMRARSWALRDGFSDVLKGLGVTEEVQDIPAKPEEVGHTVVESGPLTGAPTAPVSDLKMPSVKAAPEAATVQPKPATDHAPGVEYHDTILSVMNHNTAQGTYYGIKTATHGKAMIGTFDAEAADKARAAIGGDRVPLVYSVEKKGDKEYLKLVRIGLTPEAVAVDDAGAVAA